MKEMELERYGRQLGEACAVETLVFNQHELKSRSQGLDKWPTKGRRQASFCEYLQYGASDGDGRLGGEGIEDQSDWLRKRNQPALWENKL
ncbi:unnamed protein product [Fusarium graminearum]|uniref:Uncharacterized protein n=1 Tax=Gibberella zeae TaxID=5518 RepID=A0A4E9EIL2_GIBZA|nr:unnamed protein product [Fusarium graminearum]CAG1962458.1 unnamed protein product [Fusarium graminearum]CAG1972767.1 unnamed protein product [Fusarium graminearum]